MFIKFILQKNNKINYYKHSKIFNEELPTENHLLLRDADGRWINQPDATISQVYYLMFTRMYSSTCFGRPHAHHQELNNCSSSLRFYRWSVVVEVLLVVVGPAGPTTTNRTSTTTPQR